MNNVQYKTKLQQRRKYRIRRTVSGTTERPRLSVFISHMHVTAQIVDDTQHKTLAHATTVGQKNLGNLSQKAEWVGSEIAKKAGKVKIKAVVLDRNGKLYHGRVKALADAARNGGLEF